MDMKSTRGTLEEESFIHIMKEMLSDLERLNSRNASSMEFGEEWAYFKNVLSQIQEAEVDTSPKIYELARTATSRFIQYVPDVALPA